MILVLQTSCIRTLALILGDNLFYGNNFENDLNDANKDKDYATVFAYPVSDPKRYGIIYFDENTKDVIDIIEKPDISIVDPPRSGLHPKALKNIIKLDQKKLYTYLAIHQLRQEI